jgi:hypothetical protein
MDDMLKLYSLVSPRTNGGRLEKPIPLEIYYRVVESDKKSIVLDGTFKTERLRANCKKISRKKDLLSIFAFP